MTVVTTNLPANLFIQSTSQPVNTSELRHLDLRLDQVVQATVVEGGLDKAILEMNHQFYRAQTDKELQVGQQLRLQVLQTQPKLEFRVLNDPLKDRLAQLLPLLTRAYDWGQLISRLQQSLGQSHQGRTLSNVYSQLQQLLAPAGENVSAINESVTKLIDLLGQFTTQSDDEVAKNNAFTQLKTRYSSMPPEVKAVTARSVDRELVDLIQELQDRFKLLPRYTDRPMSQDWLSQTRSILLAIRQKCEILIQVPLSQREILLDVLTHLQAHSQVPAHLKVEVERTLVQLEKQVVQDLIPSEKQPERSAATLMKTDLSRGGSLIPPKETAFVPVAARPEGSPTQLACEIQNLVKLVQQTQKQKTALPPEVIGRLEGLLSRLQQLPLKQMNEVNLIPGMETLLSQLTQSVSQPSSFPQGGQLGILSQLFGFYLETELLQSKAKEALASLKSGLLSLQHELGEEAVEPLRRLELYQFCKSKLGEDQVQFLPLPFAELEEGYLLAERRHQKAEGKAENPALNLSLSLRLSALGNVRIDMLYDQQGLQLRIAGENQEKRDFLQSHAAELRESIQTVKLQGINFATDAQLPAKQLQQRLLPESLGMLDTRI